MGSVDPTYGVNDFNRAKVLSETETYVNNILTILFGKPGFYPSIPSLGMDIGRYLYMFEEDIDTNAIKSQLAQQCSDFFGKIDDGALDVYTIQYEGNPMLIFSLPAIISDNETTLSLGITVNVKGEMVYNFVTNSNTQVI